MGAAVLCIVGYSDFGLLQQKGVSGHGNWMQNGIQRHLMRSCFPFLLGFLWRFDYKVCKLGFKNIQDGYI
jgi:hypothetical protein